ncbi:hypothetical protein [Mameliella alba]|uniref:hypothetical protein n=1 Tax=Mameliella alba TaxID=561184 RepID=UPI001430ED4E|nr:hypothetical protein [Mameliella alba]
MSIRDTLKHLTDGDHANYLKAVDEVGAAFAARNGGITVDPEIIGELPQVREHVLSGGEYPLNLELALSALKEEPSISDELIRAEVKEARLAQIEAATAKMSPQQRISWARENGLDRPREEFRGSNLSMNEHMQVLQGLSPQQRLNYCRRHGLGGAV